MKYKLIEPKTDQFIWHEQIKDCPIPYLFFGKEVEMDQGDVPQPSNIWKVQPHLLNVKCGGYACNQTNFEGVIFDLPEFKDKFKQISYKYLESCFNKYAMSGLNFYVEYNETLKDILGVQCLQTFNKLVEAIYPFDKHYCEKFLGVKYGELKQDLIKYDEDKNSVENFINQFWLDSGMGFYILGENCD